MRARLYDRSGILAREEVLPTKFAPQVIVEPGGRGEDTIWIISGADEFGAIYTKARSVHELEV